jgi:putative membrane protein
MKKLNLTLILTISASLFLLQACENKPKDSKGQADSANAANDTTKRVKGDTSTAGYPTNGDNKDDAKFAVEAANGGMAEVELGALAQEKASSPEVKKFGAMMVTDHSKANDELVSIVKSKNITLPATVSADEQNLKAKLSKKSGADFDKAYVNDMIDDHKEDIKTFEAAAKNCKDPDIKAFAVKTLPTLKMHLDAIQKIHDSMK